MPFTAIPDLDLGVSAVPVIGPLPVTVLGIHDRPSPTAFDARFKRSSTALHRWRAWAQAQTHKVSEIDARCFEFHLGLVHAVPIEAMDLSHSDWRYYLLHMAFDDVDSKVRLGLLAGYLVAVYCIEQGMPEAVAYYTSHVEAVLQSVLDPCFPHAEVQPDDLGAVACAVAIKTLGTVRPVHTLEELFKAHTRPTPTSPNRLLVQWAYKFSASPARVRALLWATPRMPRVAVYKF